MYMFIQAKSQQGGESNPGPLAEILATLTVLNPFVSSADANQNKVKVSIYNSTWRLVTYVSGWRRTSRPPSPRHHVAGPSLDMDLPKAEIGGEAGLGTMEEQPAT